MLKSKKIAKFFNRLVVPSRTDSAKSSASSDSPVLETPSIETPIAERNSSISNDTSTPYDRKSEGPETEDLAIIEKMTTKELKTLLFDVKSELVIDVDSDVQKEPCERLLVPKILTSSHFESLWNILDRWFHGKIPLSSIFMILASKTVASLDDKLEFCVYLYGNKDGLLDMASATEMFNNFLLLDEKLQSDSKGTSTNPKLQSRRHSSHLMNADESPSFLTPSESMYNIINSRLRASSVTSVVEKGSQSIENLMPSPTIPKEFISDAAKSTGSYGSKISKMIFENMNIATNSVISIEILKQWTHRFPHGTIVLENLQQNRREKSRRFISEDERHKVKKVLESHEPQLHQPYNIISSKWWQSWAEYAGFYRQDSRSVDDTEFSAPLPIDNSSLIDSDLNYSELLEFVSLRKDIIEGLDYIIIPKEVWYCLLSWYGGGPTIQRESFALRKYGTPNDTEAFQGRHVNVHHLVNVRLDLFPLIFDIGLLSDKRFTAKCIVGGLQTLNELKQVVCEQLGLDLTKNYHLYCPAGLKHDQLQMSVIQEYPNFTIRDYNIKQGVLISEASAVKIVTKPSPTSPIMENSEIGDGLVGLENLGNTCYMNAALQCLSHIKFLANYFIYDKYLLQMGTLNSEVVLEFANFVKQLWISESRAVLSPKAMRAVIAKRFPDFGGFSQHDAQEFLAMFLDSLHEDLNRIRKKDFPKNPDWKGEADSEFSSVFWSNHLQCHQSIFVPLFHGQLKNVVECTTCRKQSINFDPFLFLTLPIPSMKFRTMKIMVISIDLEPVLTCNLQIPLEGTASEIVNAWKATNREKLQSKHYIIADIQNRYVFKVIKKTKSLSDIRDRDQIALYEYSAPSKGVSKISRVDSEINIAKSGTLGKKIYGRVMRIHIIQRRVKEDKWRRGSRLSLMGVPLVILVDTSIKENLLNQNLYENVAKRLESMYGLSMKDLTSNDSKVQPFSEAYPFAIRATNRLGTECRICSEKSCIGCIIEPDEDHEPGWDDTFCVDWKFSRSKFDLSLLMEKVVRVNVNTDKTDILNIQDCLNKFKMPEVIPDDQWNCSKCKTRQTAVKQISIYRTPLILIVHLNRFYQTLWNCIKNEAVIDIPLELDLTEHVLGQEDCMKYTLKGIINHHGGLQEGHYTSFLFNEKALKWFLFDDSDVIEVDDAKNIVSPANYILFYERNDAKSEFQTRCKPYLS